MHDTPLKLVVSTDSSSDKDQDRIAVRVILVLAAFTLLPLLVSGFVQPADLGEHLQPPPAEISLAGYFPAQYRNAAQSGIPEEHIQAF